MVSEIVKPVVENTGLFRYLVEDTFRRIRVNIFKDKGIYDIYSKTYFPNGMKIGKRFKESESQYQWYAVVVDGLWKEMYGDKSHSSLYLLDSSFSNRRDDVWETWNFNSKHEGNQKLMYFRGNNKMGEPWGTGWFFLSLQATWLSLKRCVYSEKWVSLGTVVLCIILLEISFLLLFNFSKL